MSSEPERFEQVLERLLATHDVANRARQGERIPLPELFGAETEEFWLWCLSEGHESDERLRSLLPALPSEKVQKRFTGSCGRETFEKALGFKRICLRQLSLLGETIDEKSRILDFGCGWGRISRVLLNLVAPHNLYAVDVLAEAVATCRDAELAGTITTIGAEPPLRFADGSFDSILSYSVFSHLCEGYFRNWMREFRRVLRPNGIVCFTTRPRETIEWFEDLRRSGEVPKHALGAAASFVDGEAARREYDAGRFCFDPAGGGGPGLGSFYGEACIPIAYIERELDDHFRYIGMVEFHEHNLFDQNLVVLQK